MKDYIVAAIGEWNKNSFEENIDKFSGNFNFVSNPDELQEKLKKITPRYIFFLHWRWIVPKSLVEEYECVCFHMTDVPFGRGGSPLQNLIVRGYKETILTSLRMDEGIDSGPVYIKCPMNLSGSASEIYKRSTNLSWKMINEIISREPTPYKQVGEVTEFKRRTPSQSRIPESLNISQIYDYIRMLDAEGYPKAFIENGDYKIEFDNATLVGDKLTAKVLITIREK